jgi:predicted DsbA family dithiol-disulfide isomerase
MIGFAKEVGVDEEQIRTCIVSETYKNKINAQMRTGSQKFGITGTPGHVLINTKTGEYKNVSGAVSGDKLINAIESIK